MLMQQQKQTCFSSFRSKLNTANDKFVYKWNRKQPERNVWRTWKF
ncbi:hypothetical protein HMPREF9108_02076, partial [Leptotrichia sp. oral taxon 225 str. F0581]